MYTAAILTVAQTWRQTKCPSRDEWIKKMRYVHAMECCSAIAIDEVLPFVTIWVDLENIMLNKINWS